MTGAAAVPVSSGVLRGLATVGRATLAGVAVAVLAGAAWLVWWVLVAAAVPSWSPVAITSGSMAPAIRPGDVVVAGAAGPELLTEGAVIVFRDDHHGLVTHRIADVDDDGQLRTKGDANADEDSSPVAVDDVVGRGRLLIPAVGRPMLWIQQPDWLSLGLALLALSSAAVYVSAWWRWTATAPAVTATPASHGRPRRASSRRPTEREMELIAFAWVDR